MTGKFQERGTKVFHGTAGGSIAECRFVASAGNTDGQYVHCPSGTRPQGVSPFDYIADDDMRYHRLGFANLETDGTVDVGDTVKAAGDGSGKAVLDSSPSYTSGGVCTALDPVTNIAEIELSF